MRLRYDARIIFFILVGAAIGSALLLRLSTVFRNRPEPWSSVWERKGAPFSKPTSLNDLIRIDGFDHADQYLKILHAYLEWMRPYPSQGVICDIGCGSGAFLRIIPSSKVVLCIDLSDSLLRISAEYDRKSPIVHLKRNAGDLWGIPNGLCDITIVMSVLQYMDSTAALRRAVGEALRITALNGKTFFLDIRDGDKKSYDQHRLSVGLKQSNHFFVSKTFWNRFHGARYHGTLLNLAFSVQDSLVPPSGSLGLYLAKVNPAGTEFTRPTSTVPPRGEAS